MFTYEITRTSKDTEERLSPIFSGQTIQANHYEPGDTSHWVTILANESYQSIAGFGGAFTEAAAVTFNKTK